MSETWRGFYGRGVTYGIERGKVLGIEQGKALGIEHGKILGIEQGKLQVANEMLVHGMDESLISRITGISLEELDKLRTKLKISS